MTVKIKEITPGYFRVTFPSNRNAHIRNEGSEWTGYWDNDHGTEYIADTRGLLLADMASDM